MPSGEGLENRGDNNGTGQMRPKQFDPIRSTSTRKWLEYLASAKVGEELLARGFEKHLGFKSTTSEIEGIDGKELCVYKSKKDGIYYITTEDKTQNYKENQYELQKIDNDAKENIALIEELEKNLDKIKWDLPKIYAIRTVKKEHWYKDEQGKTIEYWRDKDGNFPSGQRPEVLITDQESEVKKRTKRPSTGQPTKTWETVLPWTADGIELNHNRKDYYKEQEKFHKAYEDFSHQKKSLSEQWSVCERILSKLYYTSEKGSKDFKNTYLQARDFFKKNVVDNKYAELTQELGTYIRGVEGAIKESNNLKMLVGKDLEKLKSLVDKQEVQKEKPVERDKMATINNKINDIFKQLDDKFADSLKKLPGWDKLKIGMDVKVPENKEIIIYSDNKGTYYVTNSDSAKLTQSGTELQRKNLSGLNPNMLDGDNVQWAVPEIHAMRKFESDAEGKLHTRIFLTNDKDRYKQDSWEHLGTCDSFFSSKKCIIEKTFFNICKAEYKKMCLHYYQQYDLHKNTPDEKAKIELVRIKFEEHKNKFNGLLKTNEMGDIENQVIKEREMRIDSHKGVENGEQTSKEDVAHTSAREVWQKKKVKQVNGAEQYDRQKNLELLRSDLSRAIRTTKKCDSFAKRLYTAYGSDFDKDWLKDGMDWLGIEPKDITESHQKLLRDGYAQNIINNKAKPDQIAMSCKPDELVDNYERLVLASANLKDIHDKFYNNRTDGAYGCKNVKEKPECINGRQVLPTPGGEDWANNNCLIYSLMAVSNPGLLNLGDEKLSLEQKWSVMKETANAIRMHLVKKKRTELQSNKELTDQERQKQLDHEQKRPLNTGSDLDEIIQVMDNLKLINRDRGLLVYEWRKEDKTLLFTERLPRAKDCQDPLPPYTVLFLPDKSDPGQNHFEAMVRPEEKIFLTEGGKEYARIAGCLNNDDWNGPLPEAEEKLTAKLQEGLDNYKNDKKKKQDEEVNGKQQVNSNEEAGSKERISKTPKTNGTSKKQTEQSSEILKDSEKTSGKPVTNKELITDQNPLGEKLSHVQRITRKKWQSGNPFGANNCLPSAILMTQGHKINLGIKMQLHPERDGISGEQPRTFKEVVDDARNYLCSLAQEKEKNEEFKRKDPGWDKLRSNQNAMLDADHIPPLLDYWFTIRKIIKSNSMRVYFHHSGGLSYEDMITLNENGVVYHLQGDCDQINTPGEDSPQIAVYLDVPGEHYYALVDPQHVQDSRSSQ